MKYEDLKQEIETIAEIADGVPEMFRVRCFELLLEHLLESSVSKKTNNETPPPAKKNNTADDEGGEKPKDSSDASSIPTPSQVKVFMQKTGVTLDDLRQVVMYEDNEVHFLKEPTTQKIARGQIEWSLLLALKNGIATNNFSVDPEGVRSICQEKGFYDKANFIKNFKTPKNSSLFQGQLDAQGEAQKLSTEGQKELGTLVKEFAARTS
jgi:hypothetical protein